MIEIDNPSARWREIGQQMSGDPQWQRGVELLGLVLHHVAERYPPHEMKEFADSVTGFFFPFDHILPSHIVGIVSLVVLAIAILALYALRLAGAWRWIYVISAMIALYLNVFVGVVQAYEKVPTLKALAPTQSEPPFAITQLLVLMIFLFLTIIAAIRFRPEPLKRSTLLL